MGSNFKMLLAIFACALLLIGGCASKNASEGNETTDREDGKMTVITTFYTMHEFTKNIAKDKVNVELLTPATIDPHDWEPSPKDVAKLQKADLVVYNSEYFETWIPQIEKSLGEGKPIFVKASEGITLLEGSKGHHHGEEADEEEHHNGESHEEDHHHDGEDAHDEGHHHEFDPHVWLSPVLAQKEVENITQALIKADSENKAYYEENSQEYMAKLQELDQEYRTSLGKTRTKEFITQHAAFGYLANEYGLKEISIAGLSPSQEPSPAKLAELKQFALDNDVKVIYFEELASPKVAETLAQEVGAETEVLNTLEGLSKEDLEKGLDYIRVMQNNLKALEKSLVD